MEGCRHLCKARSMAIYGFEAILGIVDANLVRGNTDDGACDVCQLGPSSGTICQEHYHIAYVSLC